jgi:hypothetical protein
LAKGSNGVYQRANELEADSIVHPVFIESINENVKRLPTIVEDVLLQEVDQIVQVLNLHVIDPAVIILKLPGPVLI